MTGQAVPRAAVVAAMPGDIGYGTADQACDQLYAAFTAALPAELRLASPVRRMLLITGQDQQVRLCPSADCAAAAPRIPAPAARAPARQAPPRAGEASSRPAGVLHYEPWLTPTPMTAR